MTDNLERRLTRGAVEVRAAGDNGNHRIGGYAAKFDKLSQNLGGFVEQIQRGFFDKSRDAAWSGVMARYNHDVLIGTTDAGTLRLVPDDIGIGYEIDLPDTTVGRDLAVMAGRGDVHFSSFAFRVPTGGDEWGFTDQDYPLRTVRAMQLVDVAPVDDPAYFDTSSSLRSLELRSGASADEIRAAITGEPAEVVPQVENHGTATPSLDAARRRLALIEAAK